MTPSIPNSLVRIGTLIMLCHDVSDIFMETAKLFNYAQKRFHWCHVSSPSVSTPPSASPLGGCSLKPCTWYINSRFSRMRYSALRCCCCCVSGRSIPPIQRSTIAHTRHNTNAPLRYGSLTEGGGLDAQEAPCRFSLFLRLQIVLIFRADVVMLVCQSVMFG